MTKRPYSKFSEDAFLTRIYYCSLICYDYIRLRRSIKIIKKIQIRLGRCTDTPYYNF